MKITLNGVMGIPAWDDLEAIVKGSLRVKGKLTRINKVVSSNETAGTSFGTWEATFTCKDGTEIAVVVTTSPHYNSN